MKLRASSESHRRRLRLMSAIGTKPTLLADSLPLEVRTSVRQAIRRHLHFVEAEEWPAMARGQATLQSIAVGLADALTAVLSFTPVQANQQVAQERAVVAIEHALDARRNRVRRRQLIP